MFILHGKDRNNKNELIYLCEIKVIYDEKLNAYLSIFFRKM